ncbi:MAG: pyridoxal-phosphate dependent enzyme, partial [Elusimicrobia bacterium]|nr:pyridoxal-phosphate dependent enzyme [Elusimicrobiota bacterium]
PEIWRDSEGKVTHFVAGMGTGGTVTGVAKYLKEQNPKVKIIGADPIGSLYYEKIKFGRVGVAKPYVVEGIGEDIFPSTMDLKTVDDALQVTDRDCFVTTRRLARVEGLLTGGSGGAAVWAGLEYAKRLSEKDFMVILLPDTGMRYLSKIYNDEWMRENQYFESAVPLKAADVLAAKRGRAKTKGLATVKPTDSLFDAMATMRKHDISQMPVFEKGHPAGTLHEDEVLGMMLKGRQIKKMIVREAMGAALPVVEPQARIEAVLRYITPDRPAVLVRTGKTTYDILTKYDVLTAVSNASEERE